MPLNTDLLKARFSVLLTFLVEIHEILDTTNCAAYTQVKVAPILNGIVLPPYSAFLGFLMLPGMCNAYMRNVLTAQSRKARGGKHYN